MSQKSYQDEKNKLYLIPTPIGNMDDITIRALKILEEVDILLCEDTRTTTELLKYYKIPKKRLIACHDHNENTLGEKVLNLLMEGNNIGLVTDRGTPIISDPGYKVVEFITSNNYPVISLPGATAFVPALTASGIAPEPFMFYGFLPSKDNERRKELTRLSPYKETIIFYEAPHRINGMLNDLLEIFGNRRISLSREISKMYEEIYRGTVKTVIDEIKDIKGEIVVVVQGNEEIIDYNSISIVEHVGIYLEEGMSTMDAIKQVAKDRHEPKSVIYMKYHGGDK